MPAPPPLSTPTSPRIPPRSHLPPTLHSVKPVDLNALARQLELPDHVTHNVLDAVDQWPDPPPSAVSPSSQPRNAIERPVPPSVNAPAPVKLWASIKRLWDAFVPISRPRPPPLGRRPIPRPPSHDGSDVSAPPPLDKALDPHLSGRATSALDSVPQSRPVPNLPKSPTSSSLSSDARTQYITHPPPPPPPQPSHPAPWPAPPPQHARSSPLSESTVSSSSSREHPDNRHAGRARDPHSHIRLSTSGDVRNSTLQQPSHHRGKQHLVPTPDNRSSGRLNLSREQRSSERLQPPPHQRSSGRLSQTADQRISGRLIHPSDQHSSGRLVPTADQRSSGRLIPTPDQRSSGRLVPPPDQRSSGRLNISSDRSLDRLIPLNERGASRLPIPSSPRANARPGRRNISSSLPGSPVHHNLAEQLQLEERLPRSSTVSSTLQQGLLPPSVNTPSQPLSPSALHQPATPSRPSRAPGNGTQIPMRRRFSKSASFTSGQAPSSVTSWSNIPHPPVRNNAMFTPPRTPPASPRPRTDPSNMGRGRVKRFSAVLPQAALSPTKRIVEKVSLPVSRSGNSFSAPPRRQDPVEAVASTDFADASLSSGKDLSDSLTDFLPPGLVQRVDSNSGIQEDVKEFRTSSANEKLDTWGQQVKNLEAFLGGNKTDVLASPRSRPKSISVGPEDVATRLMQTSSQTLPAPTPTPTTTVDEIAQHVFLNELPRDTVEHPKHFICIEKGIIADEPEVKVKPSTLGDNDRADTVSDEKSKQTLSATMPVLNPTPRPRAFARSASAKTPSLSQNRVPELEGNRLSDRPTRPRRPVNVRLPPPLEIPELTSSPSYEQIREVFPRRNPDRPVTDVFEQDLQETELFPITKPVSDFFETDIRESDLSPVARPSDDDLHQLRSIVTPPTSPRIPRSAPPAQPRRLDLYEIKARNGWQSPPTSPTGMIRPLPWAAPGMRENANVRSTPATPAGLGIGLQNSGVSMGNSISSAPRSPLMSVDGGRMMSLRRRGAMSYGGESATDRRMAQLRSLQNDLREKQRLNLGKPTDSELGSWASPLSALKEKRRQALLAEQRRLAGLSANVEPPKFLDMSSLESPPSVSKQLDELRRAKGEFVYEGVVT